MSSEDELSRRPERVEKRIGRQIRKLGLLGSILTLVLAMLSIIEVPRLFLVSFELLFLFVGFSGILALLLILTIFSYIGRRSHPSRNG